MSRENIFRWSLEIFFKIQVASVFYTTHYSLPLRTFIAVFRGIDSSNFLKIPLFHSLSIYSTPPSGRSLYVRPFSGFLSSAPVTGTLIARGCSSSGGSTAAECEQLLIDGCFFEIAAVGTSDEPTKVIYTLWRQRKCTKTTEKPLFRATDTGELLD